MKSILLFILLFCICQGISAQSLPKQVVLEDLKGDKVCLDSLLNGKEPVVFAFWATWCKPCQSELEALLDIREEWGGKVRIVAVSVDDARTVAKVKSLVKGNRWPYEVYLDTNKELYQALNLTSIPFSMVVIGGLVVYSHSGYTPGDEVLLIEYALKSLKKHTGK